MARYPANPNQISSTSLIHLECVWLVCYSLHTSKFSVRGNHNCELVAHVASSDSLCKACGKPSWEQVDEEMVRFRGGFPWLALVHLVSFSAVALWVGCQACEKPSVIHRGCVCGDPAQDEVAPEKRPVK